MQSPNKFMYLKSRLSPTFIRYGIMAVIVVGIELLSFWVFNSLLDVNYLIATNLSLFIGIILNWLGSRHFVFGASKHSAHKEFTLVLITSLLGVMLQTSTVYIAVAVFGGQPLIGKIVAIIVTFFWNYFIRKKYIYKSLLTG